MLSAHSKMSLMALGGYGIDLVVQQPFVETIVASDKTSLGVFLECLMRIARRYVGQTGDKDTKSLA